MYFVKASKFYIIICTSTIKKHQIILNVLFQTACKLFTLLIFSYYLFMYLGEEGNNRLKT